MKEDVIHQALDLAQLFEMTVIQDVGGEESKLTFFVIADSLSQAVETMVLGLVEVEQSFPGSYMTLIKVETLGDGIRIAPALAADIVSQIIKCLEGTNGNTRQVQD